MRSLVLAAALSLAAFAGAAEGPRKPQSLGLSAPIVALTPVLVANMDALDLDAAQRAEVRSHLAAMPAKRMAFEDETVALRVTLREAILTGAPQAEREALAARIGAAETRLLLMRSGCADKWRALLSPEQFKSLVTLAAG
ncbi:hypothetical protein [Rubrimonas cliftonensis]|uniref:LTXXQ motif family protein n=1 Tax=Rubrimonas cliftonensis TaxID=89524 RepID=A0A1H3YEH5_9RHOB|nr:hypothetical protein [Rubrimonas cliftonensis]SEA09985.1 hypothetical protein SAMN05444370_10364 [Rubrimonas cliftonensis]